MNDNNTSRRDFLKASSIGGATLLIPNSHKTQDSQQALTLPQLLPSAIRTLNLSPARWIWYPMQRCLANTVVLFRKEITLASKVVRATGYILGDSRYLLYTNGKRIQFGPAPADPRFAEADPVDLTEHLQTGVNVFAAQVLYYGHGEGTWPIGKPGFIFKLNIETADGQQMEVVSDNSWKTLIARAWRPGQYKRSYLRAFQEEFDARIMPQGWIRTNYEFFETWQPAFEIENQPDKPAINGLFLDYANDLYDKIEGSQLRERSVPMLLENLVPVKKLRESARIIWKRPAQEYFESLSYDAFEVDRTPCAIENANGTWTTSLYGEQGSLLTFEFEQQSVGFPYFTIEAPIGTVIELMVQEGHKVGGAPLLNTKFNSWTRFICRNGKNTFETFDYESFRWLQLHIHGTLGPATISNVGMRRRQYPWPNQPQITIGDEKLQKVINACINTLHNCAQETIVDGMARERQQYSGDAGHQLHAIYHTFGDTQLHARFINTFGQGMTNDGYFLDTWPAYDRLARLAQRQMGLTNWGPVLDHSIGFVFDCHYYYLYTADKEGVTDIYPQLLKFFNYLLKIRGKDGLLPVENIGVPSVWIDHEAYLKQRHKQCAFNLYAVAMINHALAPLCDAFGQANVSWRVRTVAKEILAATVKAFWNPKTQIFVNNLPWLAEEKTERYCDRSLATAVLFDLCPNGQQKNAIDALEKVPENLGLSYPANANWRYWALAKAGVIQPVIDDIRTRWHDMESVKENNTIQEWWHVRHDSGQQWSHCPVAPLFMMQMGVAGIKPLAPGFKKIQIRPQLGDIDRISMLIHTIQGPVTFRTEGKIGNRTLILVIPADCEGELLVPKTEVLELPVAEPTKSPATVNPFNRYKIQGGQEIVINLKTI
jgi:alpha-L-rhamnosidase